MSVRTPATVEKKTRPYSTISNLPDSVTDDVPMHGHETCKEAFNGARDECKDCDHRRGDASRGEAVHKVASTAVKQCYEKGDDDTWHRK